MQGPIGPVCVFGPNNFPFAFNGAAGGDFAAAVAAGNPVIAKGHSSHPRTTQIFVEEAFEAARETGMPKAMIQLIYRTSHEDGYKLVAHPKLAGTGYTGARWTGLALMNAAHNGVETEDGTFGGGNQFFAELSSVNPVYFLPGALKERLDECVDEFVESNLLGVGQFCTNPGIVVLQEGDDAEACKSRPQNTWAAAPPTGSLLDSSSDHLCSPGIAGVSKAFKAAPVGTMLGPSAADSFGDGLEELLDAGAAIVTGAQRGGGQGYCFQNTLLRTTGDEFIADPEKLQTEIFGNGALVVTASGPDQMAEICTHFEVRRRVPSPRSPVVWFLTAFGGRRAT